MLRKPTLGGYHQQASIIRKVDFLAKAFAQLEVPQLADNVYTELIFPHGYNY